MCSFIRTRKTSPIQLDTTLRSVTRHNDEEPVNPYNFIIFSRILCGRV